MEYTKSNFYVPLKNFLNMVQEIWVHSFRFVPFPKSNFSMWMWTIHRCARNICITTGIVSSVCCDLDGFCFWFVGLWTCCLHYKSEHAQKELTWRLSGLAKWFMADSGIIFLCHWKWKMKTGNSPSPLGARIAQSVKQWATGCRVRVRSLPGARHFSLLHSVQTLSGAHPASYSGAAVASFPGAKVARKRIWPLTSICCRGH
jgi:hypothetical protein